MAFVDTLFIGAMLPPDVAGQLLAWLVVLAGFAGLLWELEEPTDPNEDKEQE